MGLEVERVAFAQHVRILLDPDLGRSREHGRPFLALVAVSQGRLALDRGMSGPLIGPSAYFMKSPPVQFSDEAAREMVEEFIIGNGASKKADWSNFFDAPDAHTETRSH